MFHSLHDHLSVIGDADGSHSPSRLRSEGETSLVSGKTFFLSYINHISIDRFTYISTLHIIHDFMNTPSTTHVHVWSYLPRVGWDRCSRSHSHQYNITNIQTNNSIVSCQSLSRVVWSMCLSHTLHLLIQHHVAFLCRCAKSDFAAVLPTR